MARPGRRSGTGLMERSCPANVIAMKMCIDDVVDWQLADLPKRMQTCLHGTYALGSVDDHNAVLRYYK